VAVDRERVAALVRELLAAIGEDPERPGLRLTPDRVADAYAEFFSGVGADAAAPLAHTISVARGPAPETLPSGAVMLRDIETAKKYCRLSAAEENLLASSKRPIVLLQKRSGACRYSRTEIPPPVFSRDDRFVVSVNSLRIGVWG